LLHPFDNLPQLHYDQSLLKRDLSGCRSGLPHARKKPWNKDLLSVLTPRLDMDDDVSA